MYIWSTTSTTPLLSKTGTRASILCWSTGRGIATLAGKWRGHSSQIWSSVSSWWFPSGMQVNIECFLETHYNKFFKVIKSTGDTISCWSCLELRGKKMYLIITQMYWWLLQHHVCFFSVFWRFLATSFTIKRLRNSNYNSFYTNSVF